MMAGHAAVVWEGDSRAVIKSFPEDAREHLGGDLRRMQNGEVPLDFGPMAPALPGAFELRDRDKDFWYRVLLKRIDGTIYVLHCFTKKSNETPRRDVKTAKGRLKNVERRLAAQEKARKHAEKNKRT